MSRHQKSIQRAIAPVLETLEDRRLMSAVTFTKHRAEVQGTKGDDDIRVFLSSDEQTVHIVVNGQDTTRAASKLNRVTVFGGKGNDAITFDEYQKPTLDRVQGFLYGGRGNDTITGGAADDAITGGRGDDDIAGGEGNNHMFGGGGSDTIEGVVEGSAQANAATDENGVVKTETQPAINGRTKTAVAIPSFVVRDIGLILRGIGDRIPFALNDAGDVVGVDVTDDDADPVTPLVGQGFIRFSANPVMKNVGTLTNFPDLQGNLALGDGSTSWVWDVNNAVPGLHGVEYVGMSQPGGPGTPQRGIFWDDTGLPNDIGFIQFGNTGGRSGNTIIYGMNDGGLHFNHGIPYTGAELVGESNGEAFYMPDITGPIYFMGPNQRPAGVNGRSVEVNAGHIVIGFDRTAQHAFRSYQDGVTTDLGTLRGTTTSEPFDINDNGNYMIVGVSDSGQPRSTAWKYQLGRMTALAKPAGSRTTATGVNDDEFIVGQVITRNGATDIQHAAMWLPDPTRPAGVFIDLAQLTGTAAGRILTFAHEINNSNQIVAEGTVGTNSVPINGNLGLTKHSFLLTPGRLADFGNLVSFQGNVIKPLNTAVPGNVNYFDPRLTYNIYGKVNFTVKKTSVKLDLLTTDVAFKQFPSMGLADFVFPTTGIRAVTGNGTGRFSVVGSAFVTLEDGTVADFRVRFEGTTFRTHKKDLIQGTFAAINSRGRILKQGSVAVFKGSFGPT